MSADHLSNVLDLIEVRGVLTGVVVGRGRWLTQGDLEQGLKLFAVVSGSVRMSVASPAESSEGRIELEAGDVAVVNGTLSFEMAGGPEKGPLQVIEPHAPSDALALALAVAGDEDVVLGGHIELNEPGRFLVSRTLPQVVRVGVDRATTNLRGSVYRLFEEVTGGRDGADFATRQHVQLLLLEVLRAYGRRDDVPSGWLHALADERLRLALGLMHEEPGRRWSLAELSRAAAMSRTSFVDRFRTVVGVPPLTYLAQWRMLLARRALLDRETRVAALANELGYASESAFSNAFKREVGESPMRFRRRVQAERRDGAVADGDVESPSGPDAAKS